MTQYNTINTKLLNSLLNKLKPAIKNETDVILRLSPNMIDDSNDKTNFPHELLLTDRHFLAFVRLFQIIRQLILDFRRLSYRK